MKIFYKIVFLLILGSSLQAQQELSVPLMSHLSNSSKANPAHFPTTKWTVHLPSVGFGMLHTGPSFSDLYTRNGQGSYSLNGNQALNEFDAHNIFMGSFSGDLFGVDYVWGDHSVSVNYGMYVESAIDYTNDGARLLLKGNGDAIGETLSIGPALSINAYDKLGLGYAHRSNSWSFGGRMNFLFGRKTLNTEKNDISFTTNSDYYALDLKTDYVVNSSDFVNIDMNTNKVSFEDMTYKPGLGKNGFGLGIDLAVGYEFNDEMNGYISVTDLGSITWKENLGTYSSRGQRSYDGVYIKSIANLDTASLSGMLDSIQKFVDLEKSVSEFKTNLSPNVLVGGTWKFTKKVTFDGVLGVKKVFDNLLPTVGAGVQFQMTNWSRIGGSVSYQNKQLNHIGLNTTFNFAPIEMFIATDNILTFIMPKSANTMHFRIGMNVKFGKLPKRETVWGLG